MSERILLADISAIPSAISGELPTTDRLHQLPLNRIPWEDLERLCVRLAKADPDTEHAQAYGIRHREQEGIDLYLRKKSNGRYIVWQCKRYQKFSKDDLRKAARKFLSAFRKKQAGIPIKDAEVFILSVTADLSSRDKANELERQAKRFRKLGVRLIPYDIQGLSDELKKHPQLVQDFFHPAMADAFCGIKRPAVAESLGQIAVLQTALRSAQEGLSSSGNQELDAIRDLWGEGREDEALAELAQFQSKATWPLLSPEVRAKALRIEAGLRMAKEERTRARELLTESKRIAPEANSRALETKLIHRERGAEAALAFLGVAQTDDERGLRWHLLLELGRPRDVTDEFAALPVREILAGDFACALALAQLAQLDVVAADRTIQTAIKANPRHLSSRYVAAVVDYYWGISTAFRAWTHMIWPVPPPWNLVKRDDISTGRRLRAGQAFADLVRTSRGREARDFRVWQLACLVLDSNEHVSLSKLVREWLLDTPVNIPLLVWATATGLEFDRTESVITLTQRLDDGNGSLDDLLALLGVLDQAADAELFTGMISRHRKLFSDAGRDNLWYLHQAESLLRQGKAAEAGRLASTMPGGEERLQIQRNVWQLVAENTDKKEDYERLVGAQEEEYRRTNSLESLLACCQTSRRLKRWDFVAQNAEQLVLGIGTQSALELAAEGLLRSRRPRECLDLLERNRTKCRGGDLSPFLRQLAAESHRFLSNLPAAIQELELAANAGGGLTVLMQLFQTQLQKGDLPASLQTARLLGKSSGVPAEFLVSQVIPVARHHDAELARTLIQKLVSAPQNLAPGVEVKLVDEAFRLGIEPIAAELLRKLTQQAAAGTGPLKALNVEQAREMFADEIRVTEQIWAAYARGEIPVHGLTARLNLPLARLFPRNATSKLEIASARSIPCYIHALRQ